MQQMIQYFVCVDVRIAICIYDMCKLPKYAWRLQLAINKKQEALGFDDPHLPIGEQHRYVHGR